MSASAPVQKACRSIFNDLADAGFRWWDYPTLIDAIERHVEAAVMAPNRTHVDTTEVIE